MFTHQKYNNFGYVSVPNISSTKFSNYVHQIFKIWNSIFCGWIWDLNPNAICPENVVTFYKIDVQISNIWYAKIHFTADQSSFITFKWFDPFQPWTANLHQRGCQRVRSTNLPFQRQNSKNHAWRIQVIWDNYFAYQYTYGEEEEGCVLSLFSN